MGQEWGWGVEGGLWGGWGGICGAGSGLWGEVEDGGSCGACGCYSVGLKIGIRTVGGASVGQEGGWGVAGGLWGGWGGAVGHLWGRGGYCVML